MRYLFILFSLVLITRLSGQNCLPGLLLINTQAEVDNFPVNYPGCTSVEGNIIINGTITNLNGLSQITSIGGEFAIHQCGFLMDLNGLNNLTHVGGNLTIRENINLVNVSALSNLSFIGGDFNFVTNPDVLSLNGLENLQEIGGGLVITQNNIPELTALQNVQTIGGDVDISYNYHLQSLAGLENITSLSNLTVSNNKELTSLTGLDNLTTTGSIRIEHNAKLATLNALSALHTVSGNAVFSACGLITDCQGLSNLTSVGGSFEVSYNPALQNLSGLQQLQHVGGLLSITGNNILWDISGLQSLQTIGNLRIIFNPLLSNCSVSTICNQLLNFPIFADILQNAPGCNTREEIEANCGGLPVKVRVVADLDGDCIPDPTSLPAPGVMVKLNAGNLSVYKPTSQEGIVHMKYQGTAPFAVGTPQFPTVNWGTCQGEIAVNPDTIADTAHVTLVLNALDLCPQLQTELYLPSFFRGCLVTSVIEVINTNIGGTTAENTMIALVLPEVLTTVGTNPPPALISGDTLFFNTGNLVPLGSDTIQIYVKTDCDTFLLGQTLCVEAIGMLDNPCPPELPIPSDVRVYSECLGDTTVRFTMKNITGGSTQGPHEYIIIEDEIVLMTNPFILGPFGSMQVDVPATGATYRMEATHLDDGTKFSTANEGCGGFTPGLITAFWINSHISDYDYDCREVIAGYDPNHKTAVPKGVGVQHIMERNQPITYTIDFENTGTDTVYRVLLRDVLSKNLDVSTFRPGLSSHPCTWKITGADTLEVLFQPVKLPHQAVNAAAAKGYFSFTIQQKEDLALGTKIENKASIIFDYNPPIITNTTFHTIGELTVGTTFAPDHQQNSLWKTAGNPVQNRAILTSATNVSGDQYFRLFNTSGLQVGSRIFAGRRLEYDRSGLPAGIYYYTVTDEKGGVSGGKIVFD